MADHRRGWPSGETGLTTTVGSPDRWLLAGVASPGPSGGAVRAHHLFTPLARRTGARVTAAHGRRGLPALALAVAAVSAAWLRPVAVASTQLVHGRGLTLLRGRVRAVAVDLHDHPAFQAEALGMPLDSGRRDRLDGLFEANAAAFERLIVPSRSFVDLCSLPVDRTVVVTNGTDSRQIAPGPLPDEPTVALVSGAAPGRGIELLLQAMGQVRQAIPEAVLRLALSSTGPASASYLADLAASLSSQTWVRLESVSYPGVGDFLAGASVMVVPHPPGEYYDASTPVKLFDAMASGRPVVVTPRLETRRIVEEAAAGVIASDDASGLAEAIVGLLVDPGRAEALGRNGRQAAEERYDWTVLGEQLADALLANPTQNASR